MGTGGMPTIAAIVPIRHSSRRVPRKNFRELDGRPLYQHILRTLQAVPLIDQIVVDTDSASIMRWVRTEAADINIVERPDHLRDEMVTANDILLHTVTQVEADYYLQTHCTNPILGATTVADAIGQFLRKRQTYDSLFSVTPLYTRLWTITGRALNHDPRRLIRTQDLEPVMQENSCIYLFSRDVLERQRNRIGTRPLMFPMDPEEAVDIDTELDWALAEAAVARRGGGNG